MECDQPHTDTVRDIVYHPEKRLLLSGGDDKRWVCWEVPSMQVLAQVISSYIFDCEAIPNGMLQF